MRFSPSTRGFYRADIHPDIPADAVALSDEAYRDLLDAQAAGGTIGLDEDGQPAAVLPPAPTAAEAQRARRAAALSAVNAALDAWMRVYTAGVPGAEVASWPTKAEAAAAHLAGAPAAAILTEEAGLTGETTAELAAKIVALSVVYTAAVARAAALRRNARGLIDAAATAAEVEGALTAVLADIAAAAAGEPLPSQSQE